MVVPIHFQRYSAVHRYMPIFAIFRLLWRLLGLSAKYKTHHKRSAKDLDAPRQLTGSRAAIEAVLNEYKRGRYQAALEASEALKQDGKPTGTYYFFQGLMLRFLEKFEASESNLRKCAEIQTEAKQLALIYSSLGNLMLDQGRPDEAIPLFQTSLTHWPERGSSHRDMAEAYLVLGDAEEALQWGRLAVDKENSDMAMPEDVRNLNLGEDLATLALAVASTGGDASNVEQLVRQAVAAVGENVIPSIAQVHTHSGVAYAVAGETEKSLRHLQIAAAIDADGLWGRRAKGLMAEV